jgi:hypothetical protein
VQTGAASGGDERRGAKYRQAGGHSGAPRGGEDGPPEALGVKRPSAMADEERLGGRPLADGARGELGRADV